MTHLWTDIAGIVFASVAANHLGLIPATEGVIRHRLPVVSCPKCLSFWSVLAYCLVCCDTIAAHSAITILTISFLSAWLATWLELGMGIIDHLYLKVYEKIYPTTPGDAPAADPTAGHPDSPVPDVQQTVGERPHQQ